MRGVKKTNAKCAFCGAKTISVTESTMERGGKIYKRLKVKGGYFLINKHSSRLSICSNCWARASNQLEKHESRSQYWERIEKLRRAKMRRQDDKP